MANVLFTEPAEYDLIDIEYYICVRLCNPSAASRVTDGILEKAKKLSDFPEEHSYVEDDLLGKIGIRRTAFDNYNIFYRYDDKTDVVHILRILYNRTSWKDILK